MAIVHNLYKMAFDASKAEEEKRKAEEERRKIEEKVKNNYRSKDIPERSPVYESPIDEAVAREQLTSNIQIPTNMEEILEELE